jgi:hypothetical protein
MRLYLIFIIIIFGLASAQNVNHNVEIRLPVILKLSLEGQLADYRAEVPLTIHVKDGMYEITPAQTQLKVLSNTSWQLSIETNQSVSRHEGWNLSYRLHDSKNWQSIRKYAKPIRQGKGSVNSEMIVHYGLDTIPLDGIYQVVVSYTLTNP